MSAAIYFVFILACTLQITSGFFANMTHPCYGLNYCTIKPANYPQELMNNIIRRKFNVHQKPLMQPLPVPISESRSTGPDARDDCESIVALEPIHQIQDSYSKWRIVVQAPEQNFVQVVRTETCGKRDDSPCFKPFGAPVDLVSYCKQDYNDWEFLVLTENNSTEIVTVKLPFCCSCVYKPIRLVNN